MYESTKIAETIKNTAKTRNVQLKTMLEDLDLNKNTLSNMYNGSMLKGDSLAKIADYLDCSVDYLLGRTDNPTITGGTYINGNNNNNGNQAINGNININTTEQDDLKLLEMIKKLDLIQRSKIIAKIDEIENESKTKK
ncbi:MAG: helix-turn-helix transcriptional regulator [Clostridia bacterium]|nr:helix-turn-helix transcriptional regulator [Clostridia bacterium]